MKPEQLVPTLETCKKLKDFPETCFVWDELHINAGDYTVKQKAFLETKVGFPAPTVAELMGVLPRRILHNGFYYSPTIQYTTQDVFMASYSTWNAPRYISIYNQNPAEALALLYIELKEKEVI